MEYYLHVSVFYRSVLNSRKSASQRVRFTKAVLYVANSAYILRYVGLTQEASLLKRWKLSTSIKTSHRNVGRVIDSPDWTEVPFICFHRRKTQKFHLLKIKLL